MSQTELAAMAMLDKALSEDEVAGVRQLNAGIKAAAAEAWKRHPNNPANKAAAITKALPTNTTEEA